MNIPVRYQRPLVKGLRKLVDEWWADPYEAAEKRVTENRLPVLRSARLWNDVKGYLLFVAVLCEVAAVAFIARAVWLAL